MAGWCAVMIAVEKQVHTVTNCSVVKIREKYLWQHKFKHTFLHKLACYVKVIVITGRRNPKSRDISLPSLASMVFRETVL